MCNENPDGLRPGIGPGAFCAPHIGPHLQGMMGKFMHHMQNCMGNMANWLPYNMEDRGDEYLITVPLPGRTKEDVKVSLIARSLNLEVKKARSEVGKEEKTEEVKTPMGHRPFLRKFFRFINANMDIPLPKDADADNIKSIMSHGLLKIKIGKVSAKNIDIENENN